MRCPPRALSVVMDAMIAEPVAPCHATGACVAEKGPLTNRIRRHFARIKAVRTDCGRTWLPRQRKGPKGAGTAQKGIQDTSRGRSGHFEGESQDTSQATVRTRQGTVRTRRG